MFLAAEQFKKFDNGNLVPCLMGNSLALAALKHGEVHIAGVHLVDERSGTWNPTDLKRGLGGLNCTVVTFAHWEEGIIVRQGNPKKIRAVADLSRPAVKIINREKGSGARRLLDREMRSAGMLTARIKGYDHEVLSHLEVASSVKMGLADAGIGVRAAAAICGLAFIPLQRERYDLVIPKAHYESLHGLRTLLDLIVSKPFRDELEALGGYDTRDTGKFVNGMGETLK
jgi:molybdate-binding protein